MSNDLIFKASGAVGYERQMGRWSQRLAEPFLDFVGTSDDERVLDVGCGTGNLTFAICNRTKVRNACGIDFSPDFIDRAVELNSDPRIAFRVGDACALPYDDASFDRVLSQLVLQFVPDSDGAIAEMRRVARPGAIVAAATWDTRGSLVGMRQFFDTAAMIDPGADERRARNYSRPLSRPGDLAAAWQKAGFVDLSDTMLPIRMDYESFDDYWTPITTGGGPVDDYCKSLDPEIRDKIRDAVQRAYLDGEPDGPRSYAAIAWAVKGKVPA